MTDLQLVNEGGSIVAKDPETGETRPVSLGAAQAESLETESIQNTKDHETVKVSHTRYTSPVDPAEFDELEVQDGDEWVRVLEE